MGSKANEPMARPLPYGLLMRYVAQVQRTGRCHYPPLETHLRQWAQERRLREEQAPQMEQEEERLEKVKQEIQEQQKHQPESQPGPPQEREAPALKTAPQERDAVCEQDLRREPIKRQPLPAEPRTSLPAAAEPMPPTHQAAAQEPAPAMEPATSPRAPLLAPAGGTAASSAPATPTAPAAPTPPNLRALPPATSAPAAQAPAPQAPQTPATADEGAERANPELEQVLRYREEVQRSGRCDHPELMERVGAILAARRLDGGNSREAQERLRLRCQSQMARIRADLAAHGDQDLGSRVAIGHRLGQLRALLEDGFRCYGGQLDPPLRRMVRRQLHRAAALERRLIRHQRLAPAKALAPGELELLASCLEGVLDQWLPSTAGFLRLAPRPDPANAIRPAAVHQRGS